MVINRPRRDSFPWVKPYILVSVLPVPSAANLQSVSIASKKSLV
jgi:hypothetical protein